MLFRSLSYGLDCEKHSAKEIAEHLGTEGSGAYVRVSQLKKQDRKSVV